MDKKFIFQPFEDLSPNENFVSGHKVTNESPIVHLEVLRQIRSEMKYFGEKAGSICSGGEIPLLLLSLGYRVRAFDISRMSCATALVKIALLRKLGVWRFLDQLLNKSVDSTIEILKEIAAELPPEVLKDDLSKGRYKELVGRYKFTDSWSSAWITENDIREWQKVYKDYPLSRLEAAVEALGRGNLTICHANFKDVNEVFDVLYLSNSVGWSGGFEAGHVSKLVKPHGFAIGTNVDITMDGILDRKWQSDYTPGPIMNWSYHLWRKAA